MSGRQFCRTLQGTKDNSVVFRPCGAVPRYGSIISNWTFAEGRYWLKRVIAEVIRRAGAGRAHWGIGRRQRWRKVYLISTGVTVSLVTAAAAALSWVVSVKAAYVMMAHSGRLRAHEYQILGCINASAGGQFSKHSCPRSLMTVDNEEANRCGQNVLLLVGVCRDIRAASTIQRVREVGSKLKIKPRIE